MQDIADPQVAGMRHGPGEARPRLAPIRRRVNRSVSKLIPT